MQGVINTKTIVINLFGEPSSGKSTAAMDITAKLKRAGRSAVFNLKGSCHAGVRPEACF